MRIYTLGHSTRELTEFISLLDEYSIELVVDVRRFPTSQKYPHFNREHLEASLRKRGIKYMWVEHLGGKRHGPPNPNSPNSGLRTAGFRNYADHMMTEQFKAAIGQVLDEARGRVTAIMCAEGMYWRCHRRLISDYLKTLGVEVVHISVSSKPVAHVYTECARIKNDILTYPPLDQR